MESLFKKENLVKVVFGALALLTIVGLGIAELVIYVNGNNYTSPDIACPEPSNLEAFSVEIPIIGNIFHDRLYFKNMDNSLIEQTCPSYMMDTEYRQGDNLISRTSTTVFSVTQEFSINDCHGKPVYWCKTGSLSETLSNGFKVKMTMMLKNADQTKNLAYINGDSFFQEDFRLLDYETSLPVLNMTKTAFSLTWNVKRINTTHEGSDPRVIASLLGKKHLGKKDSCNSFFRGVGIFFLVLAILLACGACYLITILVKKRTKKDEYLNQPEKNAGQELF